MSKDGRFLQPYEWRGIPSVQSCSSSVLRAWWLIHMCNRKHLNMWDALDPRPFAYSWQRTSQPKRVAIVVLSLSSRANYCLCRPGQVHCVQISAKQYLLLYVSKGGVVRWAMRGWTANSSKARHLVLAQQNAPCFVPHS